MYRFGLDEVGRRRVQLVENLQRVDLAATERAHHVAMMRELLALQAQEEGRTPSERDLDTQVGEMLGISDRAVRDFLAAVALPARVQDVATAHDLSIKHLRAAALVDKEQAVPFIDAAARLGVTGDEALAAARLVRDQALPADEALRATRFGGAFLRGAPGTTGPPPRAGGAAEEPGTEVPAPTLTRRRRTMYVRLLEIERMLTRLPLLEATDATEARLWITALDAVITTATTLRASLASLVERAGDGGETQ
ncbi:MAG: hypothetical protein NVSMB65_18350 [Chloroflexota bacterium]